MTSTSINRDNHLFLQGCHELLLPTPAPGTSRRATGDYVARYTGRQSTGIQQIIPPKTNMSPENGWFPKDPGTSYERQYTDRILLW